MIAKGLPNKEEEAILPGKRMGAHNQRKSMAVPTVSLSSALERRAFTVQWLAGTLPRLAGQPALGLRISWLPFLLELGSAFSVGSCIGLRSARW